MNLKILNLFLGLGGGISNDAIELNSWITGDIQGFTLRACPPQFFSIFSVLLAKCCLKSQKE
jgi:hypothetical protein